MENIGTDDGISDFVPLLKMKVAELKKELKSRNLPTTGSKMELVERLQLAIDTPKDEDLVLEENIGNLSQLSTLPDFEEDDILKDMEIPKPSIPTPKPLKKRAVALSSLPETQEKKISLNRTLTASASVPAISSADVKSLIEGSNKDATKQQKNTSVKTMSAQERMNLRAQRFNTSASTLQETKSNNGVVRTKFWMMKTNTQPPDIDVLKKRAERFGENVSSVMKKLEASEKVLKRKMRFGASAAGSNITSSESDQKKQRALRFGLQ